MIKWPYIVVNALFRVVKIMVSKVTFVGFRRRYCPNLPPLDLALILAIPAYTQPKPEVM